jgi:hypothetical protein
MWQGMMVGAPKEAESDEEFIDALFQMITEFIDVLFQMITEC